MPKWQRPRRGTPGDLAMRVVIAIVISGTLSALLYLTGVVITPWLLVILPIAIATTVWLLNHAFNAPEPPRWPRPEVIELATPWRVDQRTRRVAGIVADARPSRGFATRSLALLMVGLVNDRLVRHRGANPANPMASADRYLSPDFLTWLNTLNYEGGVPSLPRHVLDRYLKEIDSL